MRPDVGSNLGFDVIQWISYGPDYGPLPSLKGSGLWAPFSKVVYNGAMMGL